MTEPIPPAAMTPPDPTPPPVTPPKKRSKWRWPLRILLALIVLVVLLVLLLPTIASTSPVRSIVLGKAQAYVPHGKLAVDSWSLGWFSPIKVSGVKLYDDRGNVILDAEDVHTNLTLLQAVRQQFDISGTVIDADGHIIVYPNGHTNLGEALGQYDQPAAPAQPPPREEPKRPAEATKPSPQPEPAKNETTLPNVHGDITLKLKGDVKLVDSGQASVAQVRLLAGSGGTIGIPDINQPIMTDLQFQYDTGEATKAGTVALKSSVDAIENNKLDLANVAAKIDALVRDTDLAGFKPILAAVGQKDLTLAGVLSGNVTGELKPNQPSEINGKFTVANLYAQTPQLKDPIKAKTLDVPIKVTRTVANGVSRLKLDSAVTLPEVNVTLAGDLPEPALSKLAAKQMPGDTGSLNVTLVADLPKVAADYPNTVHLQSDTKVTDGTLTTTVALTLNPANVQSHVKTDLFVRGTQAGKPVSIDPITFTADATATDLANVVPGLRELGASFTSAFAQFDANGKSVATIQGKGSADLDKARLQAAQFVDLGKLQLAGAATFGLSSTADAKDAALLHTKFTADVQRLKLGLPDKPPLDLPLATTAVNADVATDANGFAIQQIKTVTASLLAGDSKESPLIDAALTASGVDLNGKQIAQLAVTKCAVPSLPRLQSVIDPFVTSLRDQKIQLAAGSANVVLTAKNVDLTKKTFTLDQFEAVLLKALVQKDGKELLNDTVRFRTAGTIAAGDAISADLSLLSLTSNLAKIEKGDGPLTFTKLGDRLTGNAKVTLTAALQPLLSTLAVYQQAPKPMPYGGNCNLVLALSPDGNGVTLKSDGIIDDFTLFGDDNKPAFTEKQVKLNSDVTVDTTAMNANLRTLTLDMADSHAATINVHGGVEALATERRLKDIVVAVNAVGEKAWPIVYNLLPAAQQQTFADAKVTGPITVNLTANGSYPTKPTWNESVKTVVAYGNVALGGLSTMGADVSDFNLPLTVRDGKLVTGDLRKKGAARFAKPFTVNGGQGDFGSIVLDVSDPNLLLSIGKRQKLFQKVQLNPVLANALGSLASVIFKDATDASGQVYVTAQDCQNVPLLALMNKTGTASFVYGGQNLKLNGPVMTALSGALGWGDQGIVGDITDATLALKNGIAQQDMTFALQRQSAVKGDSSKKATTNVTETIHFKGGIDLATDKFDGYTVTISQGLLLRDIRDSFPDGATIELKGKVSDIGPALARGIAELAAKKGIEKNAGKAIDKILGGLNKKNKEK